MTRSATRLYRRSDFRWTILLISAVESKTRQDGKWISMRYVWVVVQTIVVVSDCCCTKKCRLRVGGGLRYLDTSGAFIIVQTRLASVTAHFTSPPEQTKASHRVNANKCTIQYCSRFHYEIYNSILRPHFSILLCCLGPQHRTTYSSRSYNTSPLKDLQMRWRYCHLNEGHLKSHNEIFCILTRG